jgi:hypothetical protein
MALKKGSAPSNARALHMQLVGHGEVDSEGGGGDGAEERMSEEKKAL